MIPYQGDFIFHGLQSESGGTRKMKYYHRTRCTRAASDGPAPVDHGANAFRPRAAMPFMRAHLSALVHDPGSSPRALLLLPSPRRPPFEPPHLTPHPLCRCRSRGATAAPPLLPPQPRRCCVQRRPPPRPARVCTPVLRVDIPLPEKESKVLRPESRRGGGYLRTHGCGKSCQLFYFLWITFWQTQEPASGTFFLLPCRCGIRANSFNLRLLSPTKIG